LIIAVVGAGKIGEAVARAMAKSPKVSLVLVTKRNPSTLRRPLPKKLHASTDNAGAARKADVVIIAVKAADAKHVLDEVSDQTKGRSSSPSWLRSPFQGLNATSQEQRLSGP
jgi:pyrroline-5-carboxylate reductase